MTKEVTLIDYKLNKTTFTIDNFEKVLIIDMKIISGDEVIAVYYDDGKFVTYDSSKKSRFDNYLDGHYVLYAKNGINLLESKRFNDRKWPDDVIY